MKSCTFEDDTGKVCGKPMSKEEDDQDGMCSRCAGLLWENFAQPLITSKPDKPILFSNTPLA